MPTALEILRCGVAAAAAACVSTAAMAILPALTPEQQAAAAEAAARVAWSDKVGRYQLCKAQDAVAARYFADMRKQAKEIKPPAASGACEDPGAFAYLPAAVTPPLEAAGAHSPAATAVGPPSSKATQAELKGGAKR